jgi:Ribosomal protein S17
MRQTFHGVVLTAGPSPFSQPLTIKLITCRPNGKNDKSTDKCPSNAPNLQKGPPTSPAPKTPCEHWQLTWKILNNRRNYLVHDEGEICSVGDIVRIEACRPISTRKKFCLAEIIQKRKLGILSTKKEGEATEQGQNR